MYMYIVVCVCVYVCMCVCMCMCVCYMSGVCIGVFLCFYNISACYQVGLNSPSIIKLDLSS